MIVEILGKERILAFQTEHSWSRKPLAKWAETVEKGSWSHFAELRNSFRSVDYVNGFTVFDIKGNDYRLIAVVIFSRQQLVVKHLFTHDEYTRWNKNLIKDKRKKR